MDVQQVIDKAIREDRAKYSKQKALLKQQVELLTLQLFEASDRERTLKKNQETMINALN